MGGAPTPVPPSLVRTPHLVTRYGDPEEAEEEPLQVRGGPGRRRPPVQWSMGQGSAGREGAASEEQLGVGVGEVAGFPNAAIVSSALDCQIPHTCFSVPGQGALKVDEPRMPTSLWGTLLSATWSRSKAPLVSHFFHGLVW